MLALAGYPLGLRFQFFDPDPNAPAAHLADNMFHTYSEEDALARFAEGVDLITYEFENVPVSAARLLNARRPVYPPPAALEMSQDRIVEKGALSALGIPTPAFAPIGNGSDLNAEIASAIAQTGLPAVLKTRRMGYDGKGQRVVASEAELRDAVNDLGSSDLILEGFIDFSAEYSLLSARNISGEICFYPLVRNVHRGGILRRSQTQTPSAPGELQAIAESYAQLLLKELDYVGVLAIEFFVVDGALVANEIAPRVHNSGHWTIEGAETSQFENHLRAILDYPLGSTRLRGCVGMLNIIGSPPPVSDVLGIPGAHLHLYGKSSRPNRKIGHITVLRDSEEQLNAALEALERITV